MLIPPETLIDGCVRTLVESVLPAVESRFARGQLYAVADVLRNLRDRVEEKRALATAEADSARAALGRAGEALRSTGDAAAGAVARRIAEEVASAGNDPADALAALRLALASALDALEALPEPSAAGARAALGGHLAAQAIRDVSTLKPSLLAEISKG